MDSGCESLRVERFGQEDVYIEVNALLFGFSIVLCGQQNDGDGAQRALGAYLPAHLQSVHHRHQNIRDYEVRKDIFAQLETAFSVMGADASEVLFEEAFNELANLDIIIDDGNQRFVGVVLIGGCWHFVRGPVGQDGEQERKRCALPV